MALLEHRFCAYLVCLSNVPNELFLQGLAATDQVYMSLFSCMCSKFKHLCMLIFYTKVSGSVKRSLTFKL